MLSVVYTKEADTYSLAKVHLFTNGFKLNEICYTSQHEWDRVWSAGFTTRVLTSRFLSLMTRFRKQTTLVYP